MDVPAKYRDVTLKRTSDFGPGERPTVSLAITIKSRPAASFVNHLCRDLSPHVDEIIVVTTDDLVSSELLDSCFLKWQREHPELNNIGWCCIGINHKSHPHLYLQDIPETYSQGEPLNGEVYCGPFTGKSIVRDWSLVRNIGWRRCSSEWRFHLSEDEYLQTPDLLSGACAELAVLGRDTAYTHCSYTDGRSTLLYRLSRNIPGLDFTGIAYEYIDGQDTIILEPCLNTTSNTRIDNWAFHRNLWKAMYAEARQKKWDIPTLNLIHMARVAEHADMGSLVPSLVQEHLRVSLCPEERALACSTMGDHLERAGKYSEASEWHERALAEHPGPKAALRLSRSRYLSRDFPGCIKAYENACDLLSVVVPCDDGPETAQKTIVLITSALHEIGLHPQALECSKYLTQLYPTKKNVKLLCQVIE